MATPTSLPATFVAGNVLTAAQMNDLRGAFRILQVAQAAKTDTFSTSSLTAVDVTGLSVAVTPSSATNKVLVSVSIPTGMSTTGFLYFVLNRSGTDIFLSTNSISGWSHPQATSEINYLTMTFLDSPASTSAETYKLRMYVSGGTGYVGRRGSSGTPEIPSSITVMEVSA